MRSCGREAEGGGLLNRYTVLKPYRGFESLRLRHFSDAELQTRPRTATSAPVTARAFSEAKNNITSARSAGAAQREKSAFGMSARFCAVSMIEGSTALTVTLVSFSSSASASVRRSTPAFDAA